MLLDGNGNPVNPKPAPMETNSSFDQELAKLMHKYLSQPGGVAMICGDLARNHAYLLSLNPDDDFISDAINQFMAAIAMFKAQRETQTSEKEKIDNALTH